MSIADRITSMTQHTKEAYDKIESLGTDLTGVNKNLDNIADVLDDVYAGYPKVTGSGTELSLSNCKKAGMEIEYKGNTSQASLPSGYTAVDYIESSGTQYIDTGVNADYKLSLLCELAILSIGAAGAINSDTTLRHHFNNANNQGLRYYYKSISTTNQVQLFPLGQEDTNKHKYFIDIYNSKVQVDNEEIINLTERAEYDTLLNYWICKRNSDRSDLQSGMSMKVYSFKMYKENILVREFIPCYRNSDNEVGLYDLVNGVFYENQGTGDFTYGSVTNIPNPDCPQEIHTVTGENAVTVYGKNLLDIKDGTYTNKGITATVSNGEITLNGGDSSNATNFLYIDLNSNINWIQNTTYTVSVNNPKVIGTTSNYCALRINGGGQYDTKFDTVNATYTATINRNDMLVGRICIRTNSEITYDNFTIKPQIEERKYSYFIRTISRN
jgi:hypothetical protein